ncbi:hypothetical protein L6164_023552 [Bauhinia variegata]|uniref:Uncharacterized protein n=1 Tax=Bauhinia variegata TaxID=167791 RepID=A0ACB9MIJ1_BAUVA|nr:hypothetical protein L6164_023552 [Bauhinia variegata]
MIGANVILWDLGQCASNNRSIPGVIISSGLGEMNRIEDQLGDLVPNILSKLPVKSLMRFRCVDKSWGHMITDPNFISKHLVSFKQINTIDDISLLLIYVIPSPPNEISLFFYKISFFLNSLSTEQQAVPL